LPAVVLAAGNEVAVMAACEETVEIEISAADSTTTPKDAVASEAEPSESMMREETAAAVLPAGMVMVARATTDAGTMERATAEAGTRAALAIADLMVDLVDSLTEVTSPMIVNVARTTCTSSDGSGEGNDGGGCAVISALSSPWREVVFSDDEDGLCGDGEGGGGEGGSGKGGGGEGGKGAGGGDDGG